MRAIKGFHSLLLTLTLAVMTSCALLPKHLVIYNQDDAQIGIEDDPTISVKQTDVRNAQPSHLTVDEVKSLLNVIQVSGWSGTLMGIFISPTPVPLLSPEEIEKYSSPFADALKTVEPTERVFFSFPKPGGRYSEDRTAGALFLRGRYLHIVVTDHHSVLRADTGGDNLRDVRDTKGMKLWIARPAEPATVPDAEMPQWAAFETTHISLNYSQTLALLNKAVPPKRAGSANVKPGPPASVAVPSKQDVREQARELDDSNRDLRERLDDQSKKTKELSEEVDRLRQQLEQNTPPKSSPRTKPSP
ncbi:MAG TPA: hypothetical protein VH332_06060 [Nitrospira sp.]|jgi:hypothetical protein